MIEGKCFRFVGDAFHKQDDCIRIGADDGGCGSNAMRISRVVGQNWPGTAIVGDGDDVGPTEPVQLTRIDPVPDRGLIRSIVSRKIARPRQVKDMTFINAESGQDFRCDTGRRLRRIRLPANIEEIMVRIDGRVNHTHGHTWSWRWRARIFVIALLNFRRACRRCSNQRKGFGYGIIRVHKTSAYFPGFVAGHHIRGALDDCFHLGGR